MRIDNEGYLTKKITDGQEVIATAITGKGGTASASDDFATLAGEIDGLSSGGDDGITTPTELNIPIVSMSVDGTIA